MSYTYMPNKIFSIDIKFSLTRLGIFNQIFVFNKFLQLKTDYSYRKHGFIF